MAATWRATGGAIAYGSGKDMLDVFNATGTARVIRAYRMYWFNNGTAAVTGVITTGQVRRITAASAGTAVTPVKHDTSSGALDANTTCGTNRTDLTCRRSSTGCAGMSLKPHRRWPTGFAKMSTAARAALRRLSAAPAAACRIDTRRSQR